MRYESGLTCRSETRKCNRYGSVPRGPRKRLNRIATTVPLSSSFDRWFRGNPTGRTISSRTIFGPSPVGRRKSRLDHAQMPIADVRIPEAGHRCRPNDRPRARNRSSVDGSVTSRSRRGRHVALGEGERDRDPMSRPTNRIRRSTGTGRRLQQRWRVTRRRSTGNPAVSFWRFYRNRKQSRRVSHDENVKCPCNNNNNNN